MNTKRQTIWLVSMLSLMVVLSAYYLFTGNANNLNLNPQNQQAGGNVKVDTQNVTGQMNDAASSAAADSSAVQSNAQSSSAQAGTQSNAQSSSAQAGTQSNALSSADQKVLSTVQNQGKSGSDFFIAEEMKRTDQVSKESDQLISIINSNKSTDAVNEAYNKLTLLQDNEAKVTNLEDELSQDFANAIVVQENNNWKVMVQADHLEKSQAVSIIDKVVTELNVHPEQVSVQYVK